MRFFRHAAWSLHPGLLDPSFAPIAWRKLQLAMPGALALCLLPEEIHILTTAESGTEVAHATDRLLRLYDRLAPGVFSWEVGPSVGEVTSSGELLESVRQIFLGPVRYGLTRNALSWFWSNYRDLVGATAAPWPNRSILQPLLGYGSGLTDRLIDVVDEDAGAPKRRRLRRPDPVQVERVRLADVIASAVALHRTEARQALARSPARASFIVFARETGFSKDVVAKVAGVSTSTVDRHVHQSVGSEAPFLCLAEPALRAPVQSAAEQLTADLILEGRITAEEATAPADWPYCEDCERPFGPPPALSGPFDSSAGSSR